MEKHLNSCLEIFIEFLTGQKFKLINVESSSFACSKDFENDSLKFRIINEKGIIETSLTSKNSNHFFSLELVINFLNRQKCSIQNLKTRRVDLNEINKYLTENYLEIVSLFETDDLEDLQNKIYRNGC